MSAHIPQPLLWELTRGRSAYTVKRRTGGGVEFSTDPLNLTNRHTRTQDGYINDKAIGIAPSSNGGVTLLTKKVGKGNKPASGTQSSTFGPGASSRSIYSKVVNSTGGKGYRPDLRSNTVKRASAIKKSQRPAKKDHPVKLRGAKAKKAAAESS